MGILSRLFGPEPDDLIFHPGSANDHFMFLKDGKGAFRGLWVNCQRDEIINQRDELQDKGLYLIAYLLDKQGLPLDTLAEFSVTPNHIDNAGGCWIIFSPTPVSVRGTSIRSSSRIHLNRAAIEQVKANLHKVIKPL